MRRDEQGQDGFLGQPMPGTGGDARRDDDVEGHRATRDEGEGAARRDDDVEGAARRDDDVEGHRLKAPFAGDDTGPEELYRGGPTTQGEVIRRGPGDNPHGER